jgi:hypothetical protein
VPEDFITAMAEELARLMADDLEVPVGTLDVLDWLASTGLTLRPTKGIPAWHTVLPSMRA